MNISGTGGVTSALTAAQTGSEVGTAVLKKAIEIEEQTAMQLLEGVPSNPPNLGNAVDVKA